MLLLQNSETNSKDRIDDDVPLPQYRLGLVAPEKATIRDVLESKITTGTPYFELTVSGVCLIAVLAQLNPIGERPPDFRDYTAVVAYIAGAIGVIGIAYFYKLREIANRKRNDAMALSRTIRSCARSHFAALRSLPSLIDAANQHLDMADRLFRENAFGPFWDSIQEAVRTLDAFRLTVKKVHTTRDDYRLILSACSHTFPELPNLDHQLPDPLPTLQRLEKTIHTAQTNFQFATIWEQRRTREAVLVGFNTWADAVSQISARVVSALSAFA
jgi:hypothetical protein